MAVFTGDEVFQIAMELEETGQVFYEALAAACGDLKVAELCHRLARQEIDHYNKFKLLRERLASRPASHPLTWEEMDFAQALINDRVVPDPAKARELAVKGSVAEALDLAIKLEKDSILFYMDVLPAVDGDDAAAIRQIIAEEKRHAQELIFARRDYH